MTDVRDMVLLRCIRNFRTSFDDGDPETVLQAEFYDRLGPDLHVSVYWVDAQRWLETFMCHRAAAGTDFPRAAHAVDVQSLCAKWGPVTIEGCPFEAFLSESHQEIDFADEADLRAFVVELVRAVQERRIRVFEAKKAELTAWLKERRRNGDADWLAFLGTSEKWAKWAGSDSAPPPPG